MSRLNDEQWYWIDGEGSSFQVSPVGDVERVLAGAEGLGMPPVEHTTRPMPYEHGEDHLGWRIGSRTVNLRVVDHALTRTAMWQHRRRWLQAFNPEKGEGQLKVVLPDASERRLNARIVGGLSLDAKDRQGPTTQVDVIQVVATDPFPYDPTQEVVIDYFAGAASVDLSCANSGDVPTNPEIVLTGPVTSPSIEHVGSGSKLEIDYSLAAGARMTIDCGDATITLADDTNMMYAVSTSSDFFDLDRGANTIRISAAGGTGRCDVRYYHRYLGLYIS
jgi:hypothetical protein